MAESESAALGTQNVPPAAPPAPANAPPYNPPVQPVHVRVQPDNMRSTALMYILIVLGCLAFIALVVCLGLAINAFRNPNVVYVYPSVPASSAVSSSLADITGPYETDLFDISERGEESATNSTPAIASVESAADSELSGAGVHVASNSTSKANEVKETKDTKTENQKTQKYVVLYAADHAKFVRAPVDSNWTPRQRSEHYRAEHLRRQQTIQRDAAAAGARPAHVHTEAFPGFSAHLTPEQLQQLQADPSVAMIVPDFTLSCYLGGSSGARKAQRAQHTHWASHESQQAMSRLSASYGLSIGLSAASVPLDGSARTKDWKSGEEHVEEEYGGTEPNKDVHACTVVPAPHSTSGPVVPWGIARLHVGANAPRTGGGNPSRVRAYVVDTGVDAKHPCLDVAESRGYVSSEPGVVTDLNGHGTHVAGTIAAKTALVGVAPGLELVSLRVLNANGGGEFSDAIAALDSIARDRRADPQVPMVANMSLGADTGTTRYTVMDLAVARLAEQYNVTMVIAAGNSAIATDTVSPAHVRSAIVVGAFDRSNKLASFSNFGPGVTLHAPGVNILSTWPGGRFAELSGTSMAAPHVTGGVVLFLRNNPSARPDQVRRALLDASRSDTNNPQIQYTARPNTARSLTTHTALSCASFFPIV